MRFLPIALGLITALTLLSVRFFSPALADRDSATETVHVIEIKSFQFHPAVLTIAAGEQVAWKNSDFAPHTATAENWDTGKLERQAVSEPLTLVPGRYHYICAYHPGMRAVIVVERQP